MTTFVHTPYSMQHDGAARAAQAANGIRSVFATLLRRISQPLAAYLAHSRTASQDHQMWEMALADARVMADISRAMKQGAPNKVAFY